jgi:ABC-2 type transport system ATP-binding protein
VTKSASLQLLNIDKTFGADVRALENLSLSVGSGQICGFVGANGAGKSTAMRIAAGILAPDSGTIRIDGQPVSRETQRRVGYMPEERGLYPKMRVDQHLIYLARLHGINRQDSAQAASILIEKLALEEKSTAPIETLSLGNQQRVQLAAALVHAPELLILDEPFSGLDPIATDVMAAVLKEQAEQGAAILFSSHQLDLVQRICDRVAVISGGTLRADDTVEALRSVGPHRLTIGTDAKPGWADTVPGVLHAEYSNNGVTDLTLDNHSSTDQALRYALAAGSIREVNTHQLDLSEIFRELVAP